MNKDLPSIYKANNTKINNNTEVFYSFKHEKEDISRDDVNNFFESNNMFFDLPVEIKINNEIINTKIIGKVKDRLLTSTHGSISLKDIYYIKRKK